MCTPLVSCICTAAVVGGKRLVLPTGTLFFYVFSDLPINNNRAPAPLCDHGRTLNFNMRSTTTTAATSYICTHTKFLQICRTIFFLRVEIYAQQLLTSQLHRQRVVVRCVFGSVWGGGLGPSLRKRRGGGLRDQGGRYITLYFP